MPKLTNIQHLLLTTAASRPGGSLLPPCDLLGDLGEALRKSIRSLLRRGFAEEIEVATPERIWRTRGDQQIGLVITQTGRMIIGSEVTTAEISASLPTNDDPGDDDPQPVSTIDRVKALLRRSDGCALADIVSTTGWLPHTSRAALTGLRKKGHILISEKIEGVRRYRMTGDAA